MAKSITRRNAVRAMAAAGALAALGTLGGCGTSQTQGSATGSMRENSSYPAAAKNGAGQPTFAANIASQLLGSSGENSCLSPASLYVALAMLAVGASGTTQQQLLGALGQDSAEALSQSCQDMKKALEFGPTCGTDTEEDPRLMFANSIWASDAYQVTKAYEERLEQEFDAEVFACDFTDSKTNGKVSKWVGEKTLGLLSPEFDLDPATVMALVNTLYFRDCWKDPFDASQTEPADFKVQGKTVKADFMHASLTSGFGEFAECQIGQLAFSASGSTLRLLLPWEGGSAESLLSDPAVLDALLAAELEECLVNWTLPKFGIESTFDVRGALQDLGLTAMFQPSGDFDAAITPKGQTTSDLCVSTVEQGTKIAVDETGALAAAYTAITVKEMSLLRPEREVEFTLDRPFAYALLGNDGTPLFVGVVQDPTA